MHKLNYLPLRLRILLSVRCDITERACVQPAGVCLCATPYGDMTSAFRFRFEVRSTMGVGELPSQIIQF
jgi:hypothetical protein